MMLHFPMSTMLFWTTLSISCTVVRAALEDQPIYSKKSESLKSGTRTHRMKTIDKILKFQQYNNLNFGCIVWDQAYLLADYLDKEFSKKHSLRGKKVIELGAGLGLVGISAACLGGDVTITDLPETIPFMEESIERNLKELNGTGGKVKALALRWGDSENLKSFPKQDIILMSGVIYYNESVQPLTSTIVHLSHSKTIWLLAQEKLCDDHLKSVYAQFYDHVRKYFKVTELSCSDLEGRTIFLWGESLES